jgi:hypothetical protein
MNIQIRGLDKLNKKLGRLETTRTFIAPMHKATYLVKSRMADYPSAKGNGPMKFVSDKQRRYFFWAWRNGIIDVPYKRSSSPTSERLGQRWTEDVTMHGYTVTGKVGNNASYAALVQSDKFQARRFRGIWQTDKQVLDRSRRAITRFFQNTVDTALRG